MKFIHFLNVSKEDGSKQFKNQQSLINVETKLIFTTWDYLPIHCWHVAVPNKLKNIKSIMAAGKLESMKMVFLCLTGQPLENVIITRKILILSSTQLNCQDINWID